MIRLALFLYFFCFLPSLQAHEINPTIIDITVGSDQAQITMQFNAEVFLSDIDASIIADTNGSDQADVYDSYRELPPIELAEKIRAREAELLDKIILRSAGQPLALRILDIKTEAEDIALPRNTSVKLRADLPEDSQPVTVSLARVLGAFIIRQTDPAIAGPDLYSEFLSAGSVTAPISRKGGVSRPWLSTLSHYLEVGITHIIPKGLDHIVFIIGLYFFSPYFRPLLLQVTAFTVAHSVTLALATLKLISVPASIVEPLIALSIAWIGIENIYRPKIGFSRLAVVFCFGLLHGLGFAFVLGEVGLEASAFIVSLLAFNIGVELGQLFVLLPLILLGLMLGSKNRLANRIKIAASSLIALTGIYWFIERVFL